MVLIIIGGGVINKNYGGFDGGWKEGDKRRAASNNTL